VVTGFVIVSLTQGLTLTHAFSLLHNIPVMNSDKFQKLSLGTLASGIGPNGSSISGSNDNTMNDMMGTSGMMKTPQDVIIKVESNPIIPVGKESQIKLLVLDKFIQKPMTGAQVVVGIERGGAMTTMNMMGPMFQAQEQGNGTGVYLVTFTPDNNGIYTLHTHVIPPGKPMYSMMDNHIDTGVVAQANSTNSHN
jgi:hypothetical protein